MVKSAMWTIVLLWPIAGAAPEVSKDIEQQKIQLERARVEGELRLREMEIRVRREELQAKQAADKNQSFASAATVVGTVAVALITLGGTWWANKMQDRRKFHAELISKVIGTGDMDQSIQNLNFLLLTGLIDDPGGKIKNYANDKTTAPVLPSAFTSGAFRGVPPEGTGGDPDLNVLRNRDIEPPSYERMQIPDIVAHRPASVIAMNRQPRAMWPREVLKEVAAWESKGVIVEGYLKRATKLGRNSAYGSDPEAQAIHLQIVAAPDAGVETGMLAYVTPRIQARHTKWTQGAFRSLAEQNTHIRLSGWLLWNQVGNNKLAAGTMGTLWAIHPVLKVEVRRGNQWIDLDDDSGAA